VKLKCDTLLSSSAINISLRPFIEVVLRHGADSDFERRAIANHENKHWQTVLTLCGMQGVNEPIPGVIRGGGNPDYETGGGRA
jgi:hypothetical protein